VSTSPRHRRSPTDPPRGAASPGEAADLRATVALLTLLAAALYFRQLFLGETFALRDHLVYTWTERKLLADALRAGRIPEWNDLVAYGTQFAASSANGVTYPPLWLVALFPLPFSMDLAVALHVLLAGIGTALLARRLGAGALGAALAGAALMTSGYVASIAPNKIFPGIAWLPWVAWAADRVAASEGAARERLRAALLLAAMIGAELLAGDPASSVTSFLVAAILTLARAPRRLPALAWLGAATAAGVLLAAAGVLPGLALLPHTSRAALSAGESASWSLHPWRLLELVWPGLLGSPIDARYDLAELVAHSAPGALEPSWSLSVYLGAPVLALAALPALGGRRGSRALWLGAAFLVLLALGRFTPLHALFRAVFPPERVSRYPEKHVVGALVLLCALAGAGLGELGRLRTRTVAWTLGAALALLALPLAALTFLRAPLTAGLQPAGMFLAPPLDVAQALRLALRSGAASLAVALAASVLLLAAARGRLGRLALPLAVGLLLAFAAWNGWSVTPVAPAEQLAQPPALLRAVLPPGQAAALPGPPPRILRSPFLDTTVPPERQAAFRHETLLLDGPGRFGFASVPGFEGWRSQAFAGVWAGARRMPLGAFQTLFATEVVAVPGGLAPILFPQGRGLAPGVLAQLELDFGAGDDPEDEAFGFVLARRGGLRPRAFVAPRWRFAAEEDALPALLASGRAADPGLVVLTGAGGASPPDREELPLSPCAVSSYRPERVVLECVSPAGGYAVLADENAPGWRATVDGAPAPVETADVLLRAVPLGPGAHRVELAYETPLLRAGVAISALAWLALAGLAAWTGGVRLRRRGG
jgi:hypothetical protein